MKNVAVCVSGSLRSLEHCKESIVNNVINVNKDKYNLVFFFYIPYDINYTKIELMKEYNPVISINNDIKLKEVNIIWGGRQKGQEGLAGDTVSTVGIQGYLQQLYGIEKSFRMIFDYEYNYNINFDLIMRLRSDVKYETPIVIDKYDISNKLIIPAFHCFYGINDRFALGNKKNMSIYMTMYSNIYKICKYYEDTYKKIMNLRQAEVYCQMNLDMHNVKYELTKDIIFNRIRSGGIQHDKF
jgi:hypothetical protein